MVNGDDSDTNRAQQPALSLLQKTTRLMTIGAAVACTVGAFAHVGGWFSPERLTQARIVSGMEDVSGHHPGFRRAHAKGICATGWFESTGAAVPFSKAALFAPGRVPIVGRFALASGMPYIADMSGEVRSLALRFRPEGAEEWRTAMIDIPVFPFRSPQAFYDHLVASKPDPATGHSDSARMKEFAASHPEFLAAVASIGKRPVSQGFADDTYNSLDTFRFVNAAGTVTAVRWSVVPVQPVAAAGTQGAAGDKNGLFDALIAQVADYPLRWRLLFTIGNPDDPTSDPTVQWPANRRRIDAGTVVIQRLSSEESGPCVDVNFDPMVLPSGIEASDDPFPSTRSAVYSRSFTLREGERGAKPPSAVTPNEVQAGGRS